MYIVSPVAKEEEDVCTTTINHHHHHHQQQQQHRHQHRKSIKGSIDVDLVDREDDDGSEALYSLDRD